MITKELEIYYSEKGINAKNFNCSYKEKCSQGSEKFTEAKATFIPSKYESSFPKIAFLSLDSGSSEHDYERRTIDGVRKDNEQCIVNKLPKGRHWYETHCWATEILKRLGNYNINIEDSKYYFAHINSAKCCQNKKNRREADNILFENCKIFLKEEIEIIKPNIIISQGKKAENALLYIGKIEKTYENNIYLLRINEKVVLWVKTFHPSAYGYYYKQKKEMNKIIEELNNLYNYIFLKNNTIYL